MEVFTVDLCLCTAAHLKEKLPISRTATFCGWAMPTLCLYRPYQSLKNGLSSQIYKSTYMQTQLAIHEATKLHTCQLSRFCRDYNPGISRFASKLPVFKRAHTKTEASGLGYLSIRFLRVCVHSKTEAWPGRHIDQLHLTGARPR